MLTLLLTGFVNDKGNTCGGTRRDVNQTSERGEKTGGKGKRGGEGGEDHGCNAGYDSAKGCHDEVTSRYCYY